MCVPNTFVSIITLSGIVLLIKMSDLNMFQWPIKWLTFSQKDFPTQNTTGSCCPWDLLVLVHIEWACCRSTVTNDILVIEGWSDINVYHWYLLIFFLLFLFST